MESAADGIISRFTNAISQRSARAVLLMKVCINFLDQRPAGKNQSALERAQGLAAALFWFDADAVAQSELASLALSRVLHFDHAVSIDLLLHLASHNPETFQWAIRYSKLFERTESPL